MQQLSWHEDKAVHCSVSKEKMLGLSVVTIDAQTRYKTKMVSTTTLDGPTELVEGCGCALMRS